MRAKKKINIVKKRNPFISSLLASLGADSRYAKRVIKQKKGKGSYSRKRSDW